MLETETECFSASSSKFLTELSSKVIHIFKPFFVEFFFTTFVYFFFAKDQINSEKVDVLELFNTMSIECPKPRDIEL